MSSYIPSEETFSKVLSHIKPMYDYNGPNDNEGPKAGFMPVGDTKEFINKLYNLCGESVCKQYAHHGDKWEQHQIQLTPCKPVDALACLKLLNEIHYQIEYEDFDYKTFCMLNELRYTTLKTATNADKLIYGC